jgi:hypothetical protein
VGKLTFESRLLPFALFVSFVFFLLLFVDLIVSGEDAEVLLPRLLFPYMKTPVRKSSNPPLNGPEKDEDSLGDELPLAAFSGDKSGDELAILALL